jgi:hypothetical protein
MIGRDFRAPGVYDQVRQRIDRTIRLGESGIPAFLGMAARGPLDTAQRVESYDQFKRLYGAPVPHGYLHDAVYGYFANGGTSCHVVRIAHRRGGVETAEVATRARLVLKDAHGRDALLIEAANEGAWGNQIEVEVREPPEKVQTYLTFDLEEGGSSATVKSARGFERGMLVRLHSSKGEHYAVLAKVESKVLYFAEGYAATERFRSSDLVNVEPVAFDVHIRELGRREVLRGLSLAPGSEFFPDRYTRTASELIRATVLPLDGPLSERMPAFGQAASLEGGLDGLDGITPDDFIGRDEGPGHRTGLASLVENEDIDLIALPDLMACAEHSSGFSSRREVEVVQEAVLTHCETLKDRFAILDTPPDYDVEKAIAWRLRFDSDFGAIYYPWIAVAGESGTRLLPPSGHVAGVYARCDKREGPHRAPANEVLQGAIYLERNLDEEMVGFLNGHQVNPIRVLPARGIRVWGTRTLSSRKEWRFVPVRRVFNALRRALYEGTQWVVFENNTPDLWRSLSTTVKHFLGGLWEKGYFAGETVEQAFYVKCDDETNPPDQVAAGALQAEIGVAPVRPAEFITFVLEQQLPSLPE